MAQVQRRPPGNCEYYNADLEDVTQPTPTPTPSELPKTNDISVFGMAFWAAAIVMLGLLADNKRKRIF